MNLKTLSLVALLCLSTLFVLTPTVAAVSPHTVVSVNASNPVLHGLEVKTPIDATRRWVSFRGPQLYSSPDSEPTAGFPSFLTWYQIRKPEPEPAKMITLADEYSGERTFTVMLGQPAYYLMPAQSIQNGPPKEIPDSLGLFVAFQIANVDSVALPEPTPGKPAMVCLPAEQWHHEAHLPIKSAGDLLMVYELEPMASSEKATTIDQFGLNGLKAVEKRYVYVKARRSK